MRTARSKPYRGSLSRGISVQGGLCPRGLCLGDPLDRDPWTKTPLDRNPWTETPPLPDRTWDQAQRHPTRRNMEVTSYKDSPVDRHTCKNITIPQTSFAGGNNFKINVQGLFLTLFLTFTELGCCGDII